MKHSHIACAVVALGLAGGTAGAQPALPWSFGPQGLSLLPRTLSADGLPGPLEDVYVVPSRPGQNRVPYWSYTWRTYDFSPPPDGGGLRLFFYPREREAATYAARALSDAYTSLAGLFRHVPKTRLPCILYASSSEFQATHVFFITEGTLGATDPRDLRMALPFFGDVRLFSRVATHELAHQFTVQKVREGGGGAASPEPLAGFPLWFIEGLAEYAVFRGMDPEGDLLVRDLLFNPDAQKAYVLPDLFDDRARDYLGVYKLGQARVTFLAEQYGETTLLALLERGRQIHTRRRGPPPRPRPDERTFPPEDEERKPSVDDDEQGLPPEARAPGREDAGNPEPPRTFEELVSQVAGEPPQKLRERYLAFLKRRYFGTFLESRQSVADLIHYKALAGAPDAMASAGRLLLYRTVEPETGLSTLYLQDLRDPGSRVVVARDRRPGLDSLHPVDRRSMSLRQGRALYAARSGKRDVLIVRDFTTTAQIVEGRVKVRIEMSPPSTVLLGELVEVYDPALSPDGREAAIAAIDESGFRDLYRVQLDGPEKGALRRLTNDVYAERDLSYDEDRLLFASDATESNQTNLFSLGLATGELRRLTSHAAEDRHPTPALGGIVFRSNLEGKPDLFLLRGEEIVRLTDLPTGALSATASGEELLALVIHSGEQRLYRIPRASLLFEPAAAAGGRGVGGRSLSTPASPAPYPRLSVPEALPIYDPAARGNWRVEGGAAALVGGVNAGAAGILVTDLLRDHLLLLNLAVFGSLKLTDAVALYLRQSTRPELGAGIFHTFESRRDRTFPEAPNFHLQRAFGLVGLARYPLDRFRRVEGSLELRGIERFGFTDFGGDLGAEWERQNAGIEPEIVASASVGRDTMRLHVLAGPVEGNSLLASVSAGVLPGRSFAYARFLLDAQQRLRLSGRAHVLLRGAAGGSTGGRFAPQFFLSSVDNLRGFSFGDPRLLGDHYYVSNLQLIVPLDLLVQTPVLTALYGVAGFDFGATFDAASEAWSRRAVAGVLGANLALGAMVVQLHFGRLIDIGGVPGAPWVFNLSLRYLYQ